MQKKTLNAINHYKMIEPGDHVLCAVSGGIDSMSLLHVLFSLKEQLGFTLTVAHFNHGIRDNAGEDEDFVQQAAELMGLSFYGGAADIPTLSHQNGRSIEHQARESRYEFLYRTAIVSCATKIALGHTLNDQAETVLLNIGRGSGLTGAAGMPPTRGQYIRPLLFIARVEIVSYATINNVVYREDETNEQLSYTRNAVRALLRGLNDHLPAYTSNAARFASLAQQDERLLGTLAQEAYDRCYRDGGILFEELLSLPAALSSRVVLLLCRQGGLYHDVERQHIDAILHLSGTGKQLSLPHGFIARLSYNKLLIEQASLHKDYLLPLLLPGITPTPVGCFEATLYERPASLVAASYTLYAPPNLLGIVARSRRNGDKIRLFGGGTKKLKDVYIDRKTDHALRRLPVLALESSGEVLWAPGVAVSELCRVQNEQQILRINFIPKLKEAF